MDFKLIETSALPPPRLSTLITLPSLYLYSIILFREGTLRLPPKEYLAAHVCRCVILVMINHWLMSDLTCMTMMPIATCV